MKGREVSLLAVIFRARRQGDAPPVFLLVLGCRRLETSFTAAKWAGAAVLALYAVYASRRAGLSFGRSLVAAGLFAGLGVALVAL